MLIIELTVEQKNDLVGLVDVLLKANGVQALSKAVEIMNVLNSSRPKLPVPNDDEVPF